MQTYSAAQEEQMVNFYESSSEKDRRRYAAIEAAKLGRGGIACVAQLFDRDPDTIAAGRGDVDRSPEDDASGRARRKGRSIEI